MSPPGDRFGNTQEFREQLLTHMAVQNTRWETTDKVLKDVQDRLVTGKGCVAGAVHSERLDRHDKEIAALIGRSSINRSGGNSNGSMKASLFKGLFTFEGKGKASKIMAVAVSVAVMVFTIGYVHNQFRELKDGIGQQVKVVVAKEIEKMW